MLRTRSDSSSISPDKIFTGVRFVFMGLDSVSESLYRSELVSRGGTDIGRYDSICTHVIVCGRVYDDHVCLAARHDGKTLVTELWVDDSLSFGMLADAARVLYRPVRDLNGIPGSESLYICLTGYQRQERDDIMKMVSLMGAHFSKPLIANQVTHLICYKFEGEKYALAKKVNIKLVNHRWLEDCLTAWEILPIANYAKSSWELEILEAEARDSEEETEDPGTSTVGNRSLARASSMQGGMPIYVCSDVSIPTREKSNVKQETAAVTPGHSSESRLKNHRFMSSPCKGTTRGKALDICDLNNKVPEEFGHQDAGGIGQAGDDRVTTNAGSGGDVSIPSNDSLKKVGNALSSHARTPKMGSPLSNSVDEKLSVLSYSRKTLRKVVSVEESPNILSISPGGNMVENMLEAELREHRTNVKSVDIPSPTSACDRLETSKTLSQKRKSSVSSCSAKSPTLAFQDSEARAPQSPKSTTRSAVLPQDITNRILADMNSCLEGAADWNSKTSSTSQQAAPSKFKFLSYKKSLKHGKPSLGTEISYSTDSPSVRRKAELPLDACLRQPLVEPMSIANNSTSLVTWTTGVDVSPSNRKEIPDLPLGDEPKQSTDVQASIRNTSISRTLATYSRCTNEASPEEKIPKISLDGSRKSHLGTKSYNGGDTVMHDMPGFTTREPEQTGIQPQTEGVSSLDCRDPENRKLSSTATADTCNEKDAKAASGAHTKKAVAKRSFSSKKLKAANFGKAKTVASSHKAVADVKLGNVKAEHKVEKEISVERNEVVESVSNDVVMEEDKVRVVQHSAFEGNGESRAMDLMDTSMDSEKENKPKEKESITVIATSHPNRKVVHKHGRKSTESSTSIATDNEEKTQRSTCAKHVRSEPAWFILSGHRLQRKEFQMVIKRLRGRLCRDSHNWSYQATHFIVPDPVRRTEKFFAATAAGRWILKTDYLTASNEAEKFLDEEPFEWYSKGLTEDGAISLEAPRKWRLLRERTGHGAFYGMRVIIYGDCIAPTLDTLKRVVKAGDGAILATSPPYTRFLKSGVDYAVVSPSMPRVDVWVQEFLRHEVPCVVADYLVEYVCKPGYSLERHVLYKTLGWAEKSFASLLSRSEEIVVSDATPSLEDGADDIWCLVCGSRDRGEVMLICGDEGGAVGCGIGTHIDCCDPPLDAVPEGDWFCPKCGTTRGAEATPPKSTKNKSSSKCK